ncbi:hypothetical protein BT63DRAFT_427996 [Microthyrium microscopicum]|uniref:F-box domain-containing protein n=1 Tax=Microthyrium microscopicum TaxID=703497 RepID=A0A6A6U445_9PEZI|nr:hypothetical protein BT63DRAFT_427996 [Microthyrium microscopicum]
MPDMARPVPDSNSTTLPFLSLPAELRLMIYEHLVPDIKGDIRPELYDKRRSNFPLRDDGTKCAPQILRVNRQVYDEIKSMWYGGLTFVIKIACRLLFGETTAIHVYALGKWSLASLHSKWQVPILRAMRSIQFNIELDVTVWKETSQDVLSVLSAFVDYLTGAEYCLQRIRLVFSIRRQATRFFTHVETEARCMERVKDLFEPLRKLQGVKIDSWRFETVGYRSDSGQVWYVAPAAIIQYFAVGQAFYRTMGPLLASINEGNGAENAVLYSGLNS